MAEIKIYEDDARRQYTATAGQTVFPYPFPIFDETHLVVLQDAATLVIATNYTVSGVGAEAGGNVTLLVGATVGDVITIQREMPAERLSDFPIAGDFNAVTINKELDSLIMIAQQFVRDNERSFGLSTDDSTASLTIPLLADRINKFLAFDGAGEPSMVTISPTSSAAAADIVNIPTATLISDNQQDVNNELDDGIQGLKTYLAKDVAGAIDVTLTASEADNEGLEFTGILTGSINVIVPTSARERIFINSTTGAFALTVKTLAGTGIEVVQGLSLPLYCDDTDVVEASSGKANVDINGEVSELPAGAAAAAADSYMDETGAWVPLPNEAIISFNTYYSLVGGTFPLDDTIPQITEGTAIWSGAFAPNKSSGTITFEVNIVGRTTTVAQYCTFALFRSDQTDAIGAIMVRPSASSESVAVTFKGETIFSSSASLTYSVRGGVNAGALGINGEASRLFGGAEIATIHLREQF